MHLVFCAGVPVSAHATTTEGMRRAVLAGVETIEHGDGGTPEVFRLMKERGVALCPTLAIAGANRSGGLGSNEEHFGKEVEIDPGIDPDRAAILFDPQTSGGLLVAVSYGFADQVQAALTAAGVAAVRIGSVGAGDVVRPDGVTLLLG